MVWTEKNEIELSNDGDKTLKNFLNYRRKVLIKDHPNDNAQLLTKVQFDGGVVGKRMHSFQFRSMQIQLIFCFFLFHSTFITIIRQSIERPNLYI